MKIYKNWRAKVASAVVFCMAAGMMGCGGGEVNPEETDTAGKDAEEDSGEEKAMGRYLEEDVNLPEGCQVVIALEMLEDQTLRIAYRDQDYAAHIADSADKGAAWDNDRLLSDILGSEEELGCLDLAADGGIYGGLYVQSEDSPEEYFTECRYVSPEGECRVIMPKELEDIYVWSGKFTEKGTLLLSVIGNGVWEINTQDGSVVNIYEEGKHVEGFGAVGSHLIVVVDQTLHYYDLETGKPEEDEAALTEQITANPENLSTTNSQSVPLVFAEGDQKDSMFYLDRGGVYRYAYGGNVVEQIIDGSLNSIGSPDCGFVNLFRDEDGSFYLAAEDKLYRYVYSADTPAVPDTELKVYSLRDSSYITQAAALFQKKYPDIYLSIETGMTGEDAVTVTDALKTLNTEVMAGKGPDVLILDGIPEDTYIEKGMLEDISGLLEEIPLLENIKEAYTEEDGSIYRMSAKFGIPLLAGQEEQLKNITDLTSLADAVEAGAQTYSMTRMPMHIVYSPEFLLKALSDVSEPAWLLEDGTLDEAVLEDYLEQANRIYQAGKGAVEELAEKYGEEVRDTGEYQREDMTMGGQSMSLLGGNVAFGAGGLYSPTDLAMLDSAEKNSDSLSDVLWNGQAENCFFPMQTIGISAKAQEKEAAKKFVEFLFGEEGQRAAAAGGLPVNQKVYEDMGYWIAEGNDVIGYFSSENTDTGEMIELEVKNPSEETVKRVQELGKTLTVPSITNDIILDAVSSAGSKYLDGECTLEEAVSQALQTVNLYLSE